MATDRAFGESLEEVHEIFSYLMLILAGLHAAAAVFHQAILKDGVLARMLPSGRSCEASCCEAAQVRGFRHKTSELDVVCRNSPPKERITTR